MEINVLYEMQLVDEFLERDDVKNMSILEGARRQILDEIQMQEDGSVIIH